MASNAKTETNPLVGELDRLIKLKSEVEARIQPARDAIAADEETVSRLDIAIRALHGEAPTAASNGTAAPVRRRSGGSGGGTGAAKARRDKIIKLMESSPEGMTIGDIAAKVKVSGQSDDAAAQSVRNDFKAEPLASRLMEKGKAPKAEGERGAGATLYALKAA